jgi:hypothetical protein
LEKPKPIPGRKQPPARAAKRYQTSHFSNPYAAGVAEANRFPDQANAGKFNTVGRISGVVMNFGAVLNNASVLNNAPC